LCSHCTHVCLPRRYVVGGNGALSIRSKAAVMKVLAERRPMKEGVPSLPNTNEDMYFVRSMKEVSVARQTISKQVFTQAASLHGYDRPLLHLLGTDAR
jgi:hypothetical protein